jgi:precorrin-3B methylase
MCNQVGRRKAAMLNRSVDPSFIEANPMYLFPSEYFALPLVHAGAAIAAKLVERRAGFCDGVRMVAPLAAPGLTQHCAAAPRVDSAPIATDDVVVDNGDPLSPEAEIAEELRIRWSLQIGAARMAWSRLTENDLRSSQGLMHKLAALIQERYAVSQEDAIRRVKHFLEKQRS